MNSIEQEEWVFARTVADSDAVLRVYAAPEFDEMRDDGKEWIRALVVEARRTAQAELVSALEHLIELYTRWRRQFGATQGDVDSEVKAHADRDRKTVVQRKGVSVRVNIGSRRT